MKRNAAALAIAMVAVAFADIAAAQGRHDEKPHGMMTPPISSPAAPLEGGIPLKDGGRLYLGQHGVTYHFDAAGHRVRMRDGQVMEAADGTRYLMKNDAVWRSITERGTLHPTHN